MTTVALTGHRPEKIPDFGAAAEAAEKALDEFAYPDNVITGMAAGWDLIGAHVAMTRGLSITATVPWRGHKPRVADRELYDVILGYAREIVYVSDAMSFPGKWVYQKRNEWMVDHGHAVMAYWDGSSGGTKNCVDYAIKKSVPVFLIDPQSGSMDWL